MLCGTGPNAVYTPTPTSAAARAVTAAATMNRSVLDSVAPIPATPMRCMMCAAEA